VPGKRADPAPVPDAAENGDFLRRLPPRLGQRLLALEMEDHYVRAHMAAGSALILIPLHRAIAELGSVNGVQTHRSWWVARDAVTGVVRDGRNVRLQLANGVEAPVARTKIASLRAAGLLPDADG
jgi:DNA-binding LytR/AlgR family response regulator